MGIYISDLEIPKDKAVRVVIIRDDGVCVDEVGNTYGVVSLPPHGRLIDADALKWNYIRIRDDGSIGYSQYGIDRAPTIIPAEPCNDLAKPNKRKEGK